VAALPNRSRSGAGTGLYLAAPQPNYTGELPPARYQQIFAQASGRYGSTLDYARQTHEHLLRLGIRDAALTRLLRLAA